MRIWFKQFWENLPITRKLFLEILLTAALFASNLLIYAQINRMVGRMDSVYSSNVNLNELSDSPADVQNYMYRYLEVKDSDSLNDYYRAEQDYQDLLMELNVKVSHVNSRDELGIVTGTFNQMAESLKENIPEGGEGGAYRP